MSKELVNRILTSLVLLPVLFYFSFNSGIYLIIFLSLIYFLSFYEIIKNTKNLLFIFLSNLILILAFFSFYYLRGNSNSSLVILYWVLASTFLSDIGGYVVGRIIKGKKLTKISPNKTISGSIGSFFFSLLLVPLFYSKLGEYNFLILTLITIIISLISQLGDLFISYLKRKAKVKDTSDILPGHGGFLDRLDGIIFAIPIGILLFNYL